LGITIKTQILFVLFFSSLLLKDDFPDMLHKANVLSTDEKSGWGVEAFMAQDVAILTL
jgi:hypothetical protein